MSSGERRPTLMIIGGFLGAGKTTTIARIAEHLQSAGKTFGIVTNDQGSDLVDTHFLRSRGLIVNEVTGGCFCCNFDQFAAALAQYGEDVDVILAEPVGSCTDLIATLFRPIRSDHTRQFALAPLAVVIDPRRARKFLRNAGSPEINYLFQKQVEEADVLLLNKCDTLAPDEAGALVAALGERFPGRAIQRVSAATAAGLDSVRDMLTSSSDRRAGLSTGARTDGDAPLDISYERYGASEAALGWLNLRAHCSALTPMDPNAVATGVLESIARRSRERGWEIAHAKVYLIGGLGYAKASIVDETTSPTVDERCEGRTNALEIVLNARVAAEPQQLRDVAELSIQEALGVTGPSSGGGQVPHLQFTNVSAFSPSFPNPTHRIPRT